MSEQVAIKPKPHRGRGRGSRGGKWKPLDIAVPTYQESVEIRQTNQHHRGRRQRPGNVSNGNNPRSRNQNRHSSSLPPPPSRRRRPILQLMKLWRVSARRMVWYTRFFQVMVPHMTSARRKRDLKLSVIVPQFAESVFSFVNQVRNVWSQQSMDWKLLSPEERYASSLDLVEETNKKTRLDLVHEFISEFLPSESELCAYAPVGTTNLRTSIGRYLRDLFMCTKNGGGFHSMPPGHERMCSHDQCPFHVDTWLGNLMQIHIQFPRACYFLHGYNIQCGDVMVTAPINGREPITVVAFPFVGGGGSTGTTTIPFVPVFPFAMTKYDVEKRFIEVYEQRMSAVSIMNPNYDPSADFYHLLNYCHLSPDQLTRRSLNIPNISYPMAIACSWVRMHDGMTMLQKIMIQDFDPNVCYLIPWINHWCLSFQSFDHIPRSLGYIPAALLIHLTLNILDGNGIQDLNIVIAAFHQLLDIQGCTLSAPPPFDVARQVWVPWAHRIHSILLAASPPGARNMIMMFNTFLPMFKEFGWSIAAATDMIGGGDGDGSAGWCLWNLALIPASERVDACQHLCVFREAIYHIFGYLDIHDETTCSVVWQLVWSWMKPETEY